jgi:type II secretory pathway predicted ATPase ExeA
MRRLSRWIKAIDPFSDSPDPSFYVPRDATEEALAALLDCVRAPGRHALLLASPGAGKTLLLHVLATRLPPELRAVYVPNPRLTPAELCAWTLGRLDSPRWPDPMAVLRAYAAHRAQCGGALVWLIDDANRLPAETARWLAEAATRADGGLRLVFAADEEAGEGLAALRDLVRIDALSKPMRPPEIAQYVFERLYRARASDALRERCAAALDTIRETSGGIPRAVNAACERLVEEP